MIRNSSRREFLAMSAAATAAGVLCTLPARAAGQRTVIVWSEGTTSKKVYPDDINGCIVEGLKKDLEGWNIVKASIADPEQGITDELLAKADVLIWWGHKKHGDVKDALVDKIVKRVKEEGMGFIPLHSSHFAKPNKKIMGTACSWGAYIADTKTLKVIVKDARHPIAEGVTDFELINEERYSNPYAVPKPDSVVFDGLSTMKDGKTEMSQVGLTWKIGKGKVFYLQAGHESTPMFADANIRKIIANGVKWCAPEK